MMRPAAVYPHSVPKQGVSSQRGNKFGSPWNTSATSSTPAADIRVRRPSPSSLCRHDTLLVPPTRRVTWRPRLSGGSVAGVEQSASTDQGRLVAVVFSAADKGPSASAVVQLTSDYCLPSFLNLICKLPL